jgi:REP element-mobilizing transposase RayT
MTRPRSALVSVDDTPYYHVVSRCVRRTFLCGVDHATGRSFEHRRQWIEDRIRLLSSIFAIDIYAYAVMSNHVHIVLKLRPDEVNSWSDRDVAERWTCLFKGPALLRRYLEKKPFNSSEKTELAGLNNTYRERLGSLSWFMKCLNEPIAREANVEDECTGHFWEARFKSQALLSEEALLSCMAYVDLNPVRAGMAKTPEESTHTSIKARLSSPKTLEQVISKQPSNSNLYRSPPKLKPLAEFNGNDLSAKVHGILFDPKDYLQLIDATGRMLLNDKRGTTPIHMPPILQRLRLSHANWLQQCTEFEALYHKRFRRRSPLAA